MIDNDFPHWASRAIEALNSDLAKLREELEKCKKKLELYMEYVGSSIVLSDFRNVADIRAALRASQSSHALTRKQLAIRERALSLACGEINKWVDEYILRATQELAEKEKT